MRRTVILSLVIALLLLTGISHGCDKVENAQDIVEDVQEQVEAAQDMVEEVQEQVGEAQDMMGEVQDMMEEGQDMVEEGQEILKKLPAKTAHPLPPIPPSASKSPIVLPEPTNRPEFSLRTPFL
jgi:peptidoglycan hydrolase CwlO-like protein